MTGPAWCEKFRQWAAAPCPTGEWVFRGQPAGFDSVLPAMLRPGNREFYDARRLFHVDVGLASRLFETSPVFSERPLFPDVISDGIERQLETMAFELLGGPPTTLPNLSGAEIVRALAQHYDFPTLFVDVTFHPLVAAIFATHTSVHDGLRIRDEPSTVYRWPAERKGPARLQIQHGDGPVNVIDITRIHPAVARPRNQFAGLAATVSDPKPVYQPFSSPLDRLEFSDLIDVDACESFDLPAGAGVEIELLTGVGMNTFFPDCIDLGYSYMSLAGLLSLIIHEPGDDDDRHLRPEEIETLRSSYQAVILAAQNLLDRECLRLMPGTRVTDVVHRHTVVEAAGVIRLQATAARQAVGRFDSPDIVRRRELWLADRQAAMRREVETRFRMWADAVATVAGAEEGEELRRQGPPAYTMRRSSDHEWVLEELDRRLARLERMLESVDHVPVYALAEPDDYAQMVEAFVRAPAYEQRSLELHRSSSAWLAGAGSLKSGARR